MEKIIQKLIGDVQLVILVEDRRICVKYVLELKKPNLTGCFRFDFFSTLSPKGKNREEIIDWVLEDVINYWETPQNLNDFFFSYSMTTDGMDVDYIEHEHKRIMEKQDKLKRVVNQEWIDSVKTWKKLIEN